mmetsp:Transcript_8997/g.25052  ORF Transcript_8997/g.25052 Transcript_8997/m.25052 type:complete len:302 (+) Transcript_8997:1661-2566(+)
MGERRQANDGLDDPVQRAEEGWVSSHLRVGPTEQSCDDRKDSEAHAVALLLQLSLLLPARCELPVVLLAGPLQPVSLHVLLRCHSPLLVCCQRGLQSLAPLDLCVEPLQLQAEACREEAFPGSLRDALIPIATALKRLAEVTHKQHNAPAALNLEGLVLRRARVATVRKPTALPKDDDAQVHGCARPPPTMTFPSLAAALADGRPDQHLLGELLHPTPHSLVTADIGCCNNMEELPEKVTLPTAAELLATQRALERILRALQQGGHVNDVLTLLFGHGGHREARQERPLLGVRRAMARPAA